MEASLKESLQKDEKAEEAMIQAFSDIEEEKAKLLEQKNEQNLLDNFSGAY